MNYLVQTDFEGKTVVPFWTYDGNEGDYAEDFAAQAGNAVLAEGIGLSYPDRYEEADLNREMDGCKMQEYSPVQRIQQATTPSPSQWATPSSTPS